jgi:4-hydroxyphenylpyruvate dioxygenase
MNDTLMRDALVGVVTSDDALGPLPVRGTDHVRFHVGNARQAVHWYSTAFGMGPVAYRGPETGHRDSCEYLLVSGAARFVIAGEARPGTELGRHVAAYGDAVVDLALETPDVDAAVRHARERGATVVEEPRDDSDEHGTVRVAGLATAGGTRHTLVDRSRYGGPFLPGWVAAPNRFHGKPPHHPQHYFDAVDHCAGTFPPGGLPPGERPARVDEYLRLHGRPGVQHVALATSDIVRAVRAMTEMGVEFLEAPEGYHDTLTERVGETRVQLETLRELRILAARDADGYLLRTVTKPVQDRPTLFFELVERHGSLGRLAGPVSG